MFVYDVSSAKGQSQLYHKRDDVKQDVCNISSLMRLRYLDKSTEVKFWIQEQIQKICKAPNDMRRKYQRKKIHS